MPWAIIAWFALLAAGGCALGRRAMWIALAGALALLGYFTLDGEFSNPAGAPDGGWSLAVGLVVVSVAANAFAVHLGMSVRRRREHRD